MHAMLNCIFILNIRLLFKMAKENILRKLTCLSQQLEYFTYVHWARVMNYLKREPCQWRENLMY